MFYQAKIINNIDPENLQRVQVRILGVHNFDQGEIPDSILPWAEPALPLQGSIDGGYGKFEVPAINDWVWCFFTGESIINKQNPYYFALIRTINDKNSKYNQTVNEITKDKFNNEKITDKSHTEWNNGTETVKFDIQEDGNIKVYSANKNKAIIDIGGDLNRSSAVNYTNLDVWMTQIETSVNNLIIAMQTHIHTGNLGYPTTPDTIASAVPATASLALAKVAHPMVESKKLQISTYEDSQ
jgi:hypothetical protein